MITVHGGFCVMPLGLRVEIQQRQRKEKIRNKRKTGEALCNSSIQKHHRESLGLKTQCKK